MKTSRSVCAAAAILAVAIIPANANVLLNGSFESPVQPTNSTCLTFFTFTCPAIPSWSGEFYLVNGDSGGAIGGLPLTANPDGAQYIMLQTTSHIEQSVTLSQAGNYTLSWFDAGRTFFSNVQTYSVIFGGNTLGFFSTSTTSPWASHSIQFAGSPGSFTLTFQGTNLQGGDNSTFFDNIQLDPPAPVTGAAPEPSTIAMAAGALLTVLVRRVSRRCPPASRSACDRPWDWFRARG